MTDTELRDICGQDPPTTKTYDMWSAGGKAPYKNLLSGKCLAIGPTVPNGGLVVQRTCDGGAAQKWNAVKASKLLSQERWRAKPENKAYWRGADEVRRVRAWRKANPQ